MLRRVFTLLAGFFLLAVLILSAIWASHLLPPRLWPLISTHPIKNVLLEFEKNAILLVRVEPGSDAVVGPAFSDTAGSKAFMAQFRGITHRQYVFYETIAEPAFKRTPDQRIEMSGTWTIYIVPYWALLVVLGILPAWRWLPPVARWYEKRFAGAPGHCRSCGYHIGGVTDGACPLCGKPITGSAAM